MPKAGVTCQRGHNIMARRKKSDELDNDPKEKAAEEGDWGPRDEELCNKDNIKEQVLDLMKTVTSGFRGQWERGNDQLDWWDCYNCVLGGRQAYAGNSQIYVPIIKEAVDARKTRFVNQMFPRSGRNVDCITSDEKPWPLMSLLEHYIRSTRLRTQIFPAMLKNGDVEGQFNLYVTWGDTERHIAYKKNPGMSIEEDFEVDDDGTIDTEDYDVEEETIRSQRPIVEVLADPDVLVFPATCNSIEDALGQGGGVAIIRRWTKEKLKQMAADGEIDEDAAELVIGQMKKQTDDPNSPDAVKKHADAAGISIQEGLAILVGYECWAFLKQGDEKRLCRVYYGGGEKDAILGVKRNPYWNDKVPVLSAPNDKISGVFKGLSKVKFVADLQYAANDAMNEAWDSAQYAMMPIVMTDPSKNPRVGSMVLNLAAIWETNPNDTQFAQFPALWERRRPALWVAATKQEIFPGAVDHAGHDAAVDRWQAEAQPSGDRGRTAGRYSLDRRRGDEHRGRDRDAATAVVRRPRPSIPRRRDHDPAVRRVGDEAGHDGRAANPGRTTGSSSGGGGWRPRDRRSSFSSRSPR